MNLSTAKFPALLIRFPVPVLLVVIYYAHFD